MNEVSVRPPTSVIGTKLNHSVVAWPTASRSGGGGMALRLSRKALASAGVVHSSLKALGRCSSVKVAVVQIPSSWGAP